jgi:uncharacterized membrane protein
MSLLPKELQDRGTEFDRLKAMSDGVFAIVLTLLVLELHVPDPGANPTNAELTTQLFQLLPKIIAYVISYLIIGLYWVVHNRLFRHIVQYDRKLLWQNLRFLLFVSFLPFTTALSGSYNQTSLGWQIYALNIAAVGLSSVGIWRRAVKDNLISKGMSQLEIAYIYERGLPAPLVFLASIPVAQFTPDGARFVALLIPLGMLIVGRRFAHRALADADKTALPP